MKRRTLAKELCDEGAVLVNGRPSRAGREVAPGDEVTLNLRNRVLSVAVAEPLPEYQVIQDEQAAEKRIAACASGASEPKRRARIKRTRE